MDPISDYQLGDGPGVTAAVGNLYHIFSNRGGPTGPHWTESSILAQDERWRRA